MFIFQHGTAFAHSQLQLIKSPKSNPHTFSLLQISLCKIWIKTVKDSQQTSHSTTPTTLQIYVSTPTTQQTNKRKPISPSALKMAPSPFTSFLLVFVTLLLIFHLSHCKTLKRDGNVSYFTRPLHPCLFLSTFLQFG